MFFFSILAEREKERDLTKSYYKALLHQQKTKKSEVTTQERNQKLRST